MNSEKTKILVLGDTGLLGSMVYDYLSRNNLFTVVGTYNSISLSSFYNKKITEYHFDAYQKVKDQLFQILKKESPNYIINCIGIIKPHCEGNEGIKNAIKINALFPHLLAEIVSNLNENIKIIQIATDCVFDGIKGNYTETDNHNATDVYGKTKSLGEVNKPNFLNIRCSIIGPEIKGKLSLLEWFLSNHDGNEILGFDHHLWNGITTLQFAQLCEQIIVNKDFENYINISNPLHYVINETVSKYELLNIFNSVFNKSVQIKKTNNVGPAIKRNLYSIYFSENIKSMKSAIIELKEYILASDLYKNR